MSERIRELYSAFIDGELTGSELDELLSVIGSENQPSKVDSETYRQLIAVSTGYQVSQFALKHQASNRIINHYQQDLNLSNSASLEGSASLLSRISESIANDQVNEQNHATELAYADGLGSQPVQQSLLERFFNAFSDQYLKGFASATVAATVAALVLVNVQTVVNNPSDSNNAEIAGSIAQNSNGNLGVTPINNSLYSSANPNIEFSSPTGEISFVNAESAVEAKSDVSSEAQAFLVEQERLRAYMMKHAEYSSMSGGLVPFVRVVNIDELEKTSESKIDEKATQKQ